MIDDHSRVAYVEAHDDETKETATEVLRHAGAWFAERGVTVQRVFSDNGSAYKSHLWHQTCAGLDITVKKTRPYRPRPTARSNVLQLRVRPARRSASMDPRVQPPPAPLSNREGRTHH